MQSEPRRRSTSILRRLQCRGEDHRLRQKRASAERLETESKPKHLELAPTRSNFQSLASWLRSGSASQNKLLAQKQSALYCFCSASQIRKESAMAQTTVNLPRSITDEVRAEAKRLDRNIQWVLIQAWRAGRPAIKKLKAPPKAITGERNEDESS